MVLLKIALLLIWILVLNRFGMLEWVSLDKLYWRNLKTWTYFLLLLFYLFVVYDMHWLLRGKHVETLSFFKLFFFFLLCVPYHYYFFFGWYLVSSVLVAQLLLRFWEKWEPEYSFARAYTGNHSQTCKSKLTKKETNTKTHTLKWKTLFKYLYIYILKSQKYECHDLEVFQYGFHGV